MMPSGTLKVPSLAAVVGASSVMDRCHARSGEGALMGPLGSRDYWLSEARSPMRRRPSGHGMLPI